LSARAIPVFISHETEFKHVAPKTGRADPSKNENIFPIIKPVKGPDKGGFFPRVFRAKFAAPAYCSNRRYFVFTNRFKNML